MQATQILEYGTRRFITESKVATHHIISLTEDGKHALKFLGADSRGLIRKSAIGSPLN
jgi:hypothetical protein